MLDFYQCFILSSALNIFPLKLYYGTIYKQEITEKFKVKNVFIDLDYTII